MGVKERIGRKGRREKGRDKGKKGRGEEGKRGRERERGIAFTGSGRRVRDGKTSWVIEKNLQGWGRECYELEQPGSLG